MSIYIFLVGLVLIPGTIGQFKKQKYVRPDRDCGCDGYLERAKSCNWPQQFCDEDSEAFQNYQYWCGIMNEFRDDKRNGRVSETYNRTLSCFANLNEETREQMLTGLKISATPRSLTVTKTYNPRIPFNAPVLTATKDWTSWMTPVKNQGQCGSCWAFASVGYLEYLLNKKKDSKIILSVSCFCVLQIMYPYKTFASQEQRLVSCDNENGGCGGGDPAKAMDYLMNNGADLSVNLPYKSGYTKNAGTCPTAKTNPMYKGVQTYIERYALSGSSYGPPVAGNCTRLKQLLAQGPVIGGMHADQTTGIMQYGQGVYTDSKCKNNGEISHAIIITGFIKNFRNGGKDVFVVKNSYGANWALEKGYLYIDASGNTCGICSFFVYV